MAEVVKYAELYPLVLPFVPGCPDGMMLQQLQQAGREFCLFSESWREELTADDLVDGQLEYTLRPHWDAEIRKILAVRFNTTEGVTEGTDAVEQDLALVSFDQSVNELTLDDSLEPEEDVTDGLEVKVVYVPFIRTIDIAEWFMNRWAEGIVACAIKNLCRMPKKGWTNKDVAAENHLKYLQLRAMARNENEKEWRDLDSGFSA